MHRKMRDLIAQGLSGDDLLAAFREIQAKIRPAIETMLNDTEKIASGESEYATYDDISGSSPNK